MKIILIEMKLHLLSVFCLLAGSLASRIEFEGCFHGVDESRGESFELSGYNLNEDCAHFCASRGDILAATRGDTCHCTNVLPDKDLYQLLKPYELRTVNKEDNACNWACPGAVHAIAMSCRMDECCGGLSKGRKTYSFYAVGAIDPVRVMLTRIRRAVRKGLPWVPESITTDCGDVFIEQKIQRGYLMLEVEDHEYTKTYSNSIANCQAQCKAVRDGACRSIMFSPNDHRCYLNTVSSLETRTLPSTKPMLVFDRNCTANVYMLPTAFQLEMLNHQMMVSYQPSQDKMPLGNQDFELDCRQSNYWDTLRRSIEVNSGGDVTWSTESGFQKQVSRSETQSEQRVGTTTTGGSHSADWSSTTSYGYSVGVSVTAEASGNFFGASASVSGTVSSGFNSGGSNTQSGSASHGWSQSLTRSESVSATQETTASRSYNNGYTRIQRSEKRTSYEFTLTVPALHKGVMTFLKDKRTTIIKYRTNYQLNGYLRFSIGDLYEKEVHVSKVLPAGDRLLMTMGTVAYERPIIVGKTTITHKDGSVVKTEQQLLDTSAKRTLQG